MKSLMSQLDIKKHTVPLIMITIGVGVYFIFTYMKTVNNPSGIDPHNIMCLCIILALCILAYVLYYMMRIKKAAFHKCYMVTGLVFGLIFMFIIPPYSTPDEISHTWATYDVSNKIVGYPGLDEIGQLTVRVCERDAEVNGELGPIMSRGVMNNTLSSIFDIASEEENELVKSFVGYSAPRLLYLLPALGVSLGRLLSLGVVPTLLLGTLCNMLFFVGSCTYAIKKIPYGKMIIAGYCLLPMTLQQASSLSYDSPLLAATAVVLALGIRWCFTEEMVTNRELVLYLFYSSFLLIGKSSVYAVFCVLPLLYKFSKERIITIWNNYKKAIIAFVILAFVFIVGSRLVPIITSMVTAPSEAITEEISTEMPEGEVIEAPVYENYIAWANAEGYTLKWLIMNPVEFVRIIINTILVKLDFYIVSLYGQTLGWFQIGIGLWVIMLYAILGLVTTVKTSGEIAAFSGLDRAFVVFLALVCCAMCAMGMLLYWTPRTYTYIEGVQGRYFLPPYLAVLFALRNDKLVVTKNIDNKLLFANVCLGALALYYLMNAL